MKTLSSFNFKGKTVLLRADLNSDVVKGKVILGERIKASIETIKELKKKGARVVILAHQGGKGKSNFVSLKEHCKLLNKFTKVKFVNYIIEDIQKLKNGEALLLENIRFVKDEFNTAKGKTNELYKLVELCDIYVNDAFSVCHRKHFSIVGFPKYMKSCGGRLLEKEVKALKKLKIKNGLYILGGAKPEDNIKLLSRNKVLSCGLFGQGCLVAKNFKFGFQNKFLKKEADLDKKLIIKLKRKLKNVETPIDFAIKVKGGRKEILLEDFPSKFEIYDIGDRTIKKYIEEIKKAKMIFMKGPAGDCSSKKFCKGTSKILKAVADSKSFSVLGGGHLSNAITNSKINRKRFSHISLSGGALLSYLSGEKLPGLEALK
jgi:phosphoglycerate kinase